MSQNLTFRIERIGFVGNFSDLAGTPRLEVSLVLTEDQKREVLKQLGATVSGETLAQWIKEDFAWEVCDAPAI